MIIDTHVRVWPTLDHLGSEIAGRLRTNRAERWGQLDASDGALERAMSCVDAALILGFRSELLGAHVPNEFIADFVRRDPSRRLGVAGIDPMAADAGDQLEAAVQLGLVGIAISPACQGFHPTHSAAFRIYERCAELAMPVFVTHGLPLTRSAELEFARPLLWDEVARSLPELPIVLGQLGHPFTAETLVLLRKHENLWTDLSLMTSQPWTLFNTLLEAAAQGACDRILFASGYPHEVPAKAIETLYSLNAFAQGTQLPSIPRSQLRAIVERDALSCLGIEATVPAVAARVEIDRPDESRAEGGKADAAIEAPSTP